MAGNSIFQDSKMVLVFNRQGVLITMHKSLHVASETMHIPVQSISLCCLGYHISCYGYYFRHYTREKVEVVPHEDFGIFRVEEYDRMCGEVRRYHEPKEMSRRKLSAERRRKRRKEETDE